MSEDYYKDPYIASGSAARWNPKGSRMIYAASSPSLALLEYLCIRGNAVASRQWYMIVYEIRNEDLVGTLEAGSLPPDWNALPHGKATQDFGRAWLNERAFPFLRVPSARMNIRFFPGEFNLLINSEFPRLSKELKVLDAVPFSYLLNG